LERVYGNLINREEEVVLRGKKKVERLELVERLDHSWKKYFLEVYCALLFLESQTWRPKKSARLLVGWEDNFVPL
jgi:hypothetical protein